jgi:hypothetical protein
MLLGQSGPFVSTGELTQIWQQGFVENYLCGCQTHIQQCPFWNDVINLAFGGWQNVDALDFRNQWLGVSRLRRFPSMIMDDLLATTAFRRRVKAVSPTWEKLYAAVQATSGKRVIVDSSKAPMGAFALSQMEHIDLYVVHLVRDSRAVAHSLQRKKIRPEVTSRVAYLPMMPPWRSALAWFAVNLVSARLNHGHYLMLRYGDLINQPAQAIVRIGQLVHEPVDTTYLQEQTGAVLADNHTIAGNPARFKSGQVDLRLDNEWQTKMSPGARRLVTLITWPLLKRYGYL